MDKDMHTEAIGRSSRMRTTNKRLAWYELGADMIWLRYELMTLKRVLDLLELRDQENMRTLHKWRQEQTLAWSVFNQWWNHYFKTKPNLMVDLA
ncbi:hypothetical protein ACSQ67_006304 [Phaseolus vulgaris]